MLIKIFFLLFFFKDPRIFEFKKKLLILIFKLSFFVYFNNLSEIVKWSYDLSLLIIKLPTPKIFLILALDIKTGKINLR